MNINELHRKVEWLIDNPHEITHDDMLEVRRVRGNYFYLWLTLKEAFDHYRRCFQKHHRRIYKKNQDHKHLGYSSIGIGERGEGTITVVTKIKPNNKIYTTWHYKKSEYYY